LKEKRAKQLQIGKKMASYASVIKELHKPKISSAKKNELASRIEEIKKKENHEVKLKARDER
jgi:hypothetical protein